MEEKVESLFKRYEILFLVILVCAIIVLLFVVTNIPEKKIIELQDAGNGKYKITGYISDITQKESYTSFKISDETGGISGAVFKTLEINEGNIASGICELTKLQYSKRCNFDDLEIIKGN